MSVVGRGEERRTRDLNPRQAPTGGRGNPFSATVGPSRAGRAATESRRSPAQEIFSARGAPPHLFSHDPLGILPPPEGGAWGRHLPRPDREQRYRPPPPTPPCRGRPPNPCPASARREGRLRGNRENLRSRRCGSALFWPFLVRSQRIPRLAPGPPSGRACCGTAGPGEAAPWRPPGAPTRGPDRVRPWGSDPDVEGNAPHSTLPRAGKRPEGSPAGAAGPLIRVPPPVKG
jgi:hypothetical protein